MNTQHHNTEETLASWGRAQRKSPEHNDALKQEMLTQFSLKAFTLDSQRPARSFPWAPLILAGASVFVFLIGGLNDDARPLSVNTLPPAVQEEKPTAQTGGVVENRRSATDESMALPAPSVTADGASVMGNSPAPDYYYLEYPEPATPTVADAREFLKIDYHAQIKTRRVEELTDRLLLTIHGMDGRVDNTNHSRERGLIQFVIPKESFEAFRLQVEDMVGVRFLIQNVTTQNLLPQKQAIEEEKEILDGTLVALKAERARITNTHINAVVQIQARLNEVAEELRTLEKKTGGTTKERAAREARKRELQKEQAGLHALLTDENLSYGSRLGAIETRIRNAGGAIEQNEERDQELIDTVETVRGTIVLEWISVWEVVKAYGGAYWLGGLLILLAIITLFFPRYPYRV